MATELRKFMKLKYLFPLVIIASFIAAIYIPTPTEKAIGSMFLGIVGILFGIIIGFFITDLYTRFARMRELIAGEVSALTTAYAFAKVLGSHTANKRWLPKFRDKLAAYASKVLSLGLSDYVKADKEFNAIYDALIPINELKTNKETETYTNVLPVLSRLSDMREDLILFIKDRLSPAEWTTITSLWGIFLFNLFYLKTTDISSIIFTGVLSSIAFMLVLVIKDLDDLSFGYEIIGHEPYERVLDLLGKKRVYRKEDIETGVAKPPKGIKYKIIK